MIPPIKLPNTTPPLWLQNKLNRNGGALSASTSPAPTSTATAKSTAGPSGAGSSASNQGAKSSVSERSLDKPFTAARITAMVEAWENLVKTIEIADSQGETKSKRS